MASDPIAELGRFLTSSEAERLAARFKLGVPVSIAVREIASSRRERVKQLLAAAGLPAGGTTVAVLQAVAGAKSALREVTPVWTMPGHEARTGHLTGEFHRIVGAARQSVTAATYNFQETSQMWDALKAASDQADVTVTVYVDAGVADAAAVKGQLPKAVVYRSATLHDGKRVVSHAKFVVVDHKVLLITSANFSFSAENRNIEFGILVHDVALAESVEGTMRSKHGSLYEVVGPDSQR